MSNLARVGANIFIWSIVLLLVVLPGLLGSGCSVPAALLALLMLPALFSRTVRQRIAAQPANWMFLGAFVTIMICYAITAVNPGNLVYGASLLALPLASLVSGVTPFWRTEQPLLVLALLCGVGTLICALVAVNSVVLLHAERAVGFLMGPNVLARLALLLGFMSLAGLFLTRSPWRYALYLAPIAGGLVMLLTGTRGAALSLPFQALLLAVFLAGVRADRRQLLVLLGLCALGGVLVVANSGRFETLLGVIGEVLSGRGSSDGATSERLEMLAGAWGALLHSPWVGFGWANFRPAAALAMDMSAYGTDPGGLFQFHNDFANFAVAAGISGVTALVVILLAPVVGSLATPRDGLFRARLYCCLQLSVSYLMFGLTDFTLGYELPTTLYAFLSAMILACRESPAV